MREKLKKLPPLFSGAIICGIFMLIIYALKGIWPFGTLDITYDDMAQGALPMHYHIYDWLHGEKAMDLDWYTGLGLSVSNSVSFSPFHLIMLFFKRENILYSLGIIVIAYVMSSAVTSKFVFDKLFEKVNPLWKTLFSVLYAMSAFSMFYYTNTSWLNFVVVFPIIVYGLKLLLVDNKPLCYTLCFAYTLYLSIYQGFMVTLGIFLLSGLYLVLLAPKDNRKQRTCLLGISTLVGALLSAWHSVPMALQTLASKRLQTSNVAKDNFYKTILNARPFSGMALKALLAIGLQIAFVLIAILLIKLIKEKKFKHAIIVFTAAFFVTVPIFFENVNLIWHVGSYVEFPMRFFYISTFVLLALALLSIDKYGDTMFIPRKKLLRVFFSIVSAGASAVFVFTLYYLIKVYDGSMSRLVSYIIFFLVLAVGVILFALLFCQKKHVTRAFCFVLCLTQTFAVGYAGIANNKERKTEENFYNSSSYVEYCNEVAQLNIECSVLDRIKNADTSLNTNYPFLLKTPALSNWTHSIPYYVQKATAALGYSTQYTRILDSGGTAFTDGILGIKKLVQRNHHTATSQYEKINSTENFDLYENKYAVEFGVLTDEALLEDITDTPYGQRFELQNKLWKIFTGSNEDLFEICTREQDSENIKLVSSSDKELIFSYTAKENSVLYLNTGYYKKQVYKTDVNGQRISGAYYKHTTYGYFPSAAVNGFLTLGSFEAGETAEIAIRCINDGVFGDNVIQLGCMPLEKMNELNNRNKDAVYNETAGKSSLRFDYNNTASESKYIFIPVPYDDGWSCKVNGESAEINKALGAYMTVELPSGEGSVELDFTAKGTKEGIILSIAGALLLCAVVLIMKKRGYRLPKFIESTVFILFAVIFVAAVCGIYIIPSAFSVKKYLEFLLSLT